MRLRVNLSVVSAVLILSVSACAGSAVPSSGSASPALQGSNAIAGHSRPADTTSILKRLTQSVVIGSTVDAKNGDKGPRTISIAPCDHCGSLTKGQLVVCNFENSSGAAGQGTTIEALDPKPGSSATRFAQSNSIEGCDGDAVTSVNEVWGAGLIARKVLEFNDRGVKKRAYPGKGIVAPFSDADALPKAAFSPEYIFIGTTSGGLVSISSGFYGDGVATQVADGFAATKVKGWSTLAPSGLQYDRGLDTLYIVDGATDTIVAFSHASDLLQKDEIVVQPGGKTFDCEFPKVTCGSLVYSGSPLAAPVASTLLPNGNLIVANTQGTANTLVELTPQGQVLDTKVVDTSRTQGVYGLLAVGTNDANTVLFYTDINSNEVIELEQ